jgi:hypothetical protein
MKEAEKAQKRLIKELEESRKQIAKPQMLENKYERAVKHCGEAKRLQSD